MTIPEITALVAAIGSLLMAITALVRAARGAEDHESNVARLDSHQDRLMELEAKPRRRNRRLVVPRPEPPEPTSLPGSGVA